MTATAPAQLSYLSPAPAPRHYPRDPFRDRERRRLAVGVHPSGIALVAEPGTLPGDPGDLGVAPGYARCGTCAHRAVVWTDDGERTWSHNKCDLARACWTRGRATDVLLRWPACTNWEPNRARGAVNPAVSPSPPGTRSSASAEEK